MNPELQVARLGLFGRNSLGNKSANFLSHIKKIISHTELAVPSCVQHWNHSFLNTASPLTYLWSIFLLIYIFWRGEGKGRKWVTFSISLTKHRLPKMKSQNFHSEVIVILWNNCTCKKQGGGSRDRDLAPKPVKQKIQLLVTAPLS